MNVMNIEYLVEIKAMNRVVIDHNVSSQLDGASQPVEICDEDGKLLGHFVPTSSLNPSASCPYSDVDLAKMRGESGGRSLNDIWDSTTGK